MKCGKQAVQKTFSLCEAPADVDAWVYWITEALESIPQIDYPEPSGSLPASPVNATCDAIAGAEGDAENMVPGDLCEVEISGIGTLSNPVVAEG